VNFDEMLFFAFIGAMFLVGVVGVILINWRGKR